MNKLKEGDEVVVINFQSGRTGVLKSIPKNHVLRTEEYIWLVVCPKYGDGNIQGMNYRDKDLKKLTKLEKALK